MWSYEHWKLFEVTSKGKALRRTLPSFPFLDLALITKLAFQRSTRVHRFQVVNFQKPIVWSGGPTSFWTSFRCQTGKYGLWLFEWVNMRDSSTKRLSYVPKVHVRSNKISQTNEHTCAYTKLRMKRSEGGNNCHWEVVMHACMWMWH